MKSITPEMRAHLDSGVTTLTTCWHIERLDGAIFAFTEGTRSFTFESLLYRSAGGFMRSAIAADDTLSAADLEATGYFDTSALSETELRAGLFNHAQAKVFAVNWADLSMGSILLANGRFGEAVYSKAGVFKTSLRGKAYQLNQAIGELYSPGCRVRVGHSRCKVPLLPDVLPRETLVSAPTISTREATPAWRVPDLGMTQVDGDGNPYSNVYHDKHFICVVGGTTATVQPAYDYTVDAITVDGTAQFKCQEDWTRSAVVTAVTSAVSFQVDFDYPDPRIVDDAFLDGVIYFESGSNAGANVECRSSTVSSGTLVAYLKGRYTPEIGDRLSVSWGCDNTINGAAGCVLRFANPRNYQGEPFVPGPDQLLFYPNAGGGNNPYTTTYTSSKGGSGKGRPHLGTAF